ncbi:20S proteasome beta subunit, type 4 [Dunaliella salina]|uniref:20S proteasome beta subunit, type 4 n=1 Tax=Dunaliella salina TaxID=3046 RepID=A0ABQ7GTG5_DUNSA|nr:20S proteasome beta subunit, type 4 [Dunaliella salina]|eukprot:KAF5837899.1 20S proteasome beta subunit, type 4 [Dunaliella salina]
MIPRPTSHSPALGWQLGPSLAHPIPTAYAAPSSAADVCTPSCGAQACMVDGNLLEKQAGADPRQHTKYPYVTGTSVIGLKYKDGVMIVADTLGAYGSTKRYKSMDRVVKVNKHTLLGAGGEISDFQYIQGLVGMTGTHYTDSHVTSGFANALARPLLRAQQRDDMSEEKALALLHEALRVCYYRDKQSINKFTVAKATKDGVTVSEPFSLDTRWDYKLFAQPTKWAVGAW